MKNHGLSNIIERTNIILSKICLTKTISNTFFIILLLVIEQLIVFMEIQGSEYFIREGIYISQPYQTKILSPYNIIFNNCSEFPCYIDDIYLLVSYGIIILYFIIHVILLLKNLTISSPFNNLLSKFIGNFLLIFYHLIISFIYLVLANRIIYYMWEEKFSLGTDFIMFVIHLIIMIVISILNFLYFKYVNISYLYKKEIKFHSDSLFGNHYNIFMMIIKIIIAIEINARYINVTSLIKVSIFMNLVKILIQILFSVFIFIRVKKGFIIFVYCMKYNILRYFLISYSSIDIFIRYIFYNEFLSINAIVFYIANLLISYSLTKYVSHNNMMNLYNITNTNFNDIIKYLINARIIYNETKFQLITRRIVGVHNYYCNDSNCGICEEKDTSYISLKTFVKMISRNIKKKDISNYLKFELKFLKIIALFIDDQDINFNTIYFKSLKILKIKNLEQKVSANVSRFIAFIKPTDVTSNNIMIDMIKIYESTNILLEESIDKLKYMIQNVSNTPTYDLDDDSNFLLNNKMKIMSNMKIIIEKKNTFLNEYYLNIMRFVFNHLYNSDIECLKSVIINEDLIETKEKCSRTMYIKYNLENQDLIITNYSNDFFNFKNANFIEIFPSEIQEYGKAKFLDLVLNNQESYFTFDFIIKDKTKLLKGVSMKCSVLESFKDDELLIVAEYKIIDKIYLIYEEINENTNFILSSLKLLELIHIPAKYLKFLKELSLNNIFRKKDKKSFEVSNMSDIYYIDYKFYQIHHNLIINKIKKLLEDDNLDEYSEELKRNLNKKIELEIRLDHTVSLPNKNITIYKISEMAKYNRNHGEIINEEDDDELTPVDNNTSAFHSSSSMITNLFGANVNEEKKEATKFKKIRRYVMSAVFINILLILCGFMSLFIMIQNDINAQNLFKLKIIFNDLETSFYQSTMGFLASLAIYRFNSTDKSNYYLDAFFYDQFKIYPEITIVLPNHVNEVTFELLQNFYTYMETYKKAIYNEKYIFGDSLVFDVDIYKMISEINENGEYDIHLSKYKADFYDTVNVYMNKIKMILENTVDYYFVFILTFRDHKLDTSNFFFKTLTEYEENVYYLFLNYIDLMKGFMKIRNTINDASDKFTDNIDNTYVYLFICNIVINSIFSLDCILIIIFFSKFLGYQNDHFVKIFEKDNIMIITKKLKVLEKLNRMYEENPLSLINTLNDEHSKNLKNQIKSEAVNINFDLSNVNQKENQKFKYVYISKLSFPFIKRFVVIFLFLYFYFIVTLFISKLSFGNLKNTMDYFNTNSYLDTYILNNINVLEISLITNSTDIIMAEEINEVKSEIGYVRHRINEYFQIKSILETNSNFKYQQTYLDGLGIDLTDCKSIYSKLNDPIINILGERHGLQNMIDSLTATCKHQIFMNNKNLDYLYEEMIYKNQYILNSLEFANGDYTILKFVNDDFEFFGMYFIGLTIMRPLKTFIDKNVVSMIVDSSFKSFRLFNIFSLLLNIIVDIMILSIVVKLVNKMLAIFRCFISLENSLNDVNKIL